MRIISASRRTDIPAFYSRWFLDRLEAGYCHWINPFNTRQVLRVSLKAEDCLGIVFWTRNPAPLLPHLEQLQRAGHRFYFHFTINRYPSFLESNSPPEKEVIDVFHRVSDRIGADLVFWRYDPIVISGRTPPEYHLDQFQHLSSLLQGATHRCYVSFLDVYGKTRRNLDRVRTEHGVSFDPPPSRAERVDLARRLSAIAGERGIALYSCCGDELLAAGVAKAHCIDWDVLVRLGAVADRHLKHAPTRQDCGCVEAADIGAYDTCAFGCAYCYATNSRKTALARLAVHDPGDTVLWRPASLRGVDLIAMEAASSSLRRPEPSPVQLSLPDLGQRQSSHPER